MLGFGAIKYNNVGVPTVGVSAADIVDAYDTVMEKKNNYIAVKLANDNNSRKRAGAAVIGANAGLLQMAGLFGIYTLVKAFPKLNNALIDKFVIKNFDKWIKIAQKNAPNESKLYQLGVALGAKSLVAMGIGAGLGVAFDWYSAARNTIINGRIQNTKSGEEGTWIASGLQSMYASTTGKLTIKNAIQKNDDGSVTIKFKGVNKEYTITKKELKDASRAYITRTNEDGKVVGFDKKFSKGDGDTLAFEVAFEKYCKDVENGVVPKDKHLHTPFEKITEDGDMLFSNGRVDDLYYLLTGKESHFLDLSPDSNNDNVMDIYSKASINKFIREYSQNPEGFACEIRLKSGVNDKIKVRDKYYQTHNLKTDKAYAVTGLDDKFVTISDTTKTRKSFEIPIERIKDSIESINYVEMS